ncbi:DEAD/DEAH box helicase [Anaerorudis cellulosivorans]|jgi:replicative superfamily II helicase|uniref:DEAD/DEAH box helicase n=1 Tax=Anaerorudis cellulosivorans TaxID=3397862 RepID=UPI00221FB56F|nr:DEAD/DEAH box helicase [Seramator thermalis]MCW1734597.1 DEAD/DEAH box helicase [Seramator thermalis]
MNIEHIEESYQVLESDSTLQNLIAQANARYILYNTGESQQNFPRYTIKDEQLNTLAFKYLNVGCNYFEKHNYTKAAHSLEKGAAILEYIHGSLNTQTKNKNLFCLISALAYYVSFQYSKSFILISKIQSDTTISSLISLFLSRHFDQLLSEIDQLLTDSSYDDEYLAEHFDEDDTTKIYEIIIAKALNHYVQFYHTGNNEFLEIAKRNLIDLQDIAGIKGEPDIWWVIRLLLLIIEGFKESSLWHVLGHYFNIKDKFPLKYIQSLVYKNGSITELFLTQRNSLPKVLNNEQNGSIVSIPTSSGKTRIGEIAILNCLVNEPDAKILFIAPFRSLAYEIENSLDEIFSNLDISVSHLYGGSLFSKLDEKIINESSVIVATPEKAKALLRSSKEILSCIKLVIVDEGHLFGANKRLIVNEMFYEELRYHIGLNGGKFLLLSAVLPNAEDLSEWLTGSSNNVYKENWRPSDERIGIMEWNGVSVNINWRSTDTERNSFNPNFIVRQELPKKPRQRKIRYFPADKNQAIATTAYKLRNFGPVLIFVGVKRSVFTLAREYEKCIQPEDGRFRFKNKANWKAFKLACIESYGEDSEWLRFAKLGIFCHNADLLSDVRLPLERLMRSEKPRVIIATSTLGQGVNLGVSTVIFSTLYQAREPITKRDFWNIAGRAGRAFVDHEGKILVAHDVSGKDKKTIDRERGNITSYLDKDNIDKAKSGCLALIRGLKIIALRNGVPFDVLLNLLAENRIAEIHEQSDEINDLLDWIDDGLLSLHNSNNIEGNKLEWVDEYFPQSLAYLQTQYYDDITGDEVLEFVKARIKGITRKVGEEKENWENVVSSGIPINSDLQIEDRMDEVIRFVQDYVIGGQTLEDLILLLENIENTINDINVLEGESIESVDSKEIRRKWLSGIAMSDISQHENAIKIITNHYSFNLPWILNGISKKLKKRDLTDEADVIEELAILVELGLPNIKSIKVYQAGIRSRSSALEIANLYEDELWEKSIKTYKQDLINHADFYKEQVSENAASWIDLLVKFSKREIIKIERVPNFKYGKVHKRTKRLIARLINDEQFLLSTDFSVINKIGEDSNVDFSNVNDLNGIYFDYDEKDNLWKMKCINPYIKFE